MGMEVEQSEGEMRLHIAIRETLDEYKEFSTNRSARSRSRSKTRMTAQLFQIQGSRSTIDHLHHGLVPIFHLQ
jgi:hypothetical protein